MRNCEANELREITRFKTWVKAVDYWMDHHDNFVNLRNLVLVIPRLEDAASPPSALSLDSKALDVHSLHWLKEEFTFTHEFGIYIQSSSHICIEHAIGTLKRMDVKLQCVPLRICFCAI